MPTTEYSPLVEAASALNGLSNDVRDATELVADLRALVGKFELTALVDELDDLSDRLMVLLQGVEEGAETAAREAANAIEDKRPIEDERHGRAQLAEAVLDVERGLGTWADVVALARKLA